MKKISVFLLLLSTVLVMSQCGPDGGTGPLDPEYDVVYVSSTGDDANMGTNETQPVRTLGRAWQVVAQFKANTIKFEQGTYNNGDHFYESTKIQLNGKINFTFTGGWNSTFTSQTGYSTFNDDGSGGILIDIDNSQNITISKFVADDILSRLIEIDDSQNINIQDLVMSNHTVTSSGTIAIRIIGSSDVSIVNAFVTDKPGAAGLSISSSTNITIDNYTYINSGNLLSDAPYTFLNVVNVKILNSVLTNNLMGFATNIVSLYSSGVTLSNNRIGGMIGSNAVAIFEPIPLNVTGYQLLDNKIVTNSIGFVIRDYNNGYSSSLADLNNATWSDASQASGNTFVVF